MSNDASGMMKVVATRKETLARLLKILNYKDGEYCLYRCKYAVKHGNPRSEGRFWVLDIDVSGAWTCQPFYNYGDRTDKNLVLGYEKDGKGREDFTKPIYGTAHFTDLAHLAEVLDFGCELWATEPACCFAEHIVVNHDGEGEYEHEQYELHYPENEDGEADYDAEPEEECGFGCELNTYSSAEEIYGESPAE